MDSSENTKEAPYKNILKATSLFGGVQVYTIIVQILRSKVAALLLGPAGMGIMGLLNSTIEMVSSVTNFGLSTSAVRNIADSSSQQTNDRLRIVITVFRRLVWITGLLGTSVALFFSGYLSQVAFGDKSYRWAFMILSVNVLLSQLAACQSTVLQGLQRYKDMAKCSVYGSTLGLIITVPLYFFLGIDAIVPVLITSNVLSFVFTWLFYKKIKIDSIKIPFSTLKAEGYDMLKMGVLISLSGILGLASAYFLKVYIGRYGSIEDVGLFNAGFTMVESYVGLIFIAMAKDYYPRLSKISQEKDVFKATINSQTEISIILLLPIVALFVVFAKPLVILLYSDSFLAIEGMIYWAISAIIIKSMAWSLSYAILAKGNSRLFFTTEIVAVIYGFILNIVGYSLYGLTGLGISYFLKYLIYFVQLYIVTKYHFDFSFVRKALSLAFLAMIIVVMALLTKSISNMFVSYLSGIVIVVLSVTYSYKELNKRVHVSQYISEKLWKRR